MEQHRMEIQDTLPLKGAPTSRSPSFAPRILVWAIAVSAITGLLAAHHWLPRFGLLDSSALPTDAGAALLIFLAALACEYVDSSLGMGYGTTLTPLLLLAGFEPLQIVPAVLLSECLSGFAACAMHQRDGNVDFRADRRARQTARRQLFLALATTTR